MGKFAKYRIHFDLFKGVLMARSDPLELIEQVEEYKRVFGCGRCDNPGAGVMRWHADRDLYDNINSIRLAYEWLDELEYVYPNKAAVIRGMLNACDQNP